MMHLLFIRHAESTGNQQRRMMGWQNDPLSTIGRQQAIALAQQLIAESYYPTTVYSSPIQRAKETAIALVNTWHTAEPTRPPLPIQYHTALQEFQNGVFRGLTWGEARQQYPNLCDRLESSPSWIPIPEAETLTQGRERANGFIEMVFTQHQAGDRLCIVTHHWILQQLVSVLMGCDRTWGFAAEYTARFEFRLNPAFWDATDQNRWNSDLWQIVRFGDRAHWP
jgi:broad specificity phosphatase PhoE